MMKLILTGLIAMVALTACSASVVTREHSLKKPQAGVTYYLPTQNLQLKVERKLVTEAKLKKDLDTLIEAKTKQAEEEKKQKIVAETIEKKLKEAKGLAKAKLELELELAKIDLLVAKRDLTEIDRKIAEKQTEIAGYKENPVVYRDVFTLESKALQPDLDKVYVASVKKNFWTSETLELKTTPGGLLTGGSGKSEGNLDEIIVAAFQAFASVSPLKEGLKTAFPLEKKVSAIQPEDPCLQPEEKSYSAEFSFDSESIKNLANNMKQQGFCYRLSWQVADSLTKANEVQLPEKECTDGCVGGLLYPRQIRVGLKVTEHNESNYQILYADVIDRRSVAYIPLDASMFATNDYEYEFNNGLLTRYKSVTPNEFVGFFSMIPAAGKALLSIPAEILQLKIDYSSKEEGYYKAQQTLMEARLAYEEALAKQQAE